MGGTRGHFRTRFGPAHHVAGYYISILYIIFSFKGVVLCYKLILYELAVSSTSQSLYF
jgi:hypothetical protein